MSVNNFCALYHTVLKVLVLQCPFWICGLLMRGRCVWSCQFAPVTFDLELGHNLEMLEKKSRGTGCVQGIDAVWPGWVCGLLPRGECACTCHFAPVTFGSVWFK